MAAWKSSESTFADHRRGGVGRVNPLPDPERGLAGALRNIDHRHAELDPALVQRRENSRRAVGAAAKSYTNLLVQAAGKESLDAALAELERKKTEYAEIEGEINGQTSDYNAVLHSPALTADEIRSNIVDRDSALLEYCLGEDRSYLWLITPERIASFKLPARARIEATARLVYQLLTARNRR